VFGFLSSHFKGFIADAGSSDFNRVEFIGSTSLPFHLVSSRTDSPKFPWPFCSEFSLLLVGRIIDGNKQ
jgi:hypothetical protein